MREDEFELEEENKDQDEEDVIILTHPITEEDLTCETCDKKLSSIQAFVGHMKTKHSIRVEKKKKVRKGDAKKAEMQARKDLKAKQKLLPLSVLDIKKLVPDGMQQRERERVFCFNISKRPNTCHCRKV
jgi:hypothetical protein